LTTVFQSGFEEPQDEVSRRAVEISQRAQQVLGVPIIMMTLALGGMLVLAQGSAVAPFIYRLL